MATRKSDLAKARADAAEEFVNLAKPYIPEKHEHVFDGSWMVSEKYDGIRGRLDARGYLLSRSQNKLPGVPEPVLAEIQLKARDLMLDGEIWAGRGVDRFRYVSGAARTNKTTAADWAREGVKFVVFDYYGEEPYWQRYRALLNLGLNDSQFCVLAPQFKLQSPQHLSQEKETAAHSGAEGLILRDAKSPYMLGRHENLLKVVTRVREEFEVIDHVEGTGKHTGRLGAFVCRMEEGATFKVGSGMTDDDRNNWLPSVGSRVTVEFKGYTQEVIGQGVPREPTYIANREEGT